MNTVVYFSYLLRIWSEKDFDHISWRLSLEKPGTGEMFGFNNLDALMDFLTQKIDAENETTNPDGTGECGAL